MAGFFYVNIYVVLFAKIHKNIQFASVFVFFLSLSHRRWWPPVLVRNEEKEKKRIICLYVNFFLYLCISKVSEGSCATA